MSAPTKNPGGRPPKPVPDAPEITAALRKSRRSIARAESKLADEVTERDAAVRQAVAAGWSHAAVADEVGVSKGRIGQILAG